MGPERSWVNGNVFSKKNGRSLIQLLLIMGGPEAIRNRSCVRQQRAGKPVSDFITKGIAEQVTTMRAGVPDRKKKTPTLGSLPVKMNTPVHFAVYIKDTAILLFCLSPR